MSECRCNDCSAIPPEPNCTYEPDYEAKCENCGQSPCVVVKYLDGSPDHHFDMCGPCTFGSAECIDPENW